MSIRSFYLFIFIIAFPLFSFAGPVDESRVDISSLTTVDGSHPANLVPHPTTPNMYIQRSLDPMTGSLTEVFYTVAETENGRKLIPIDVATARDLNAALRQDGNFRRNFTGAVRGFPAEYGKFNAAMIVMELVGCYGIGNGSLFNEWKWAPTTNTNTPLCAEHLLKAMTTLEGNIGFFSFVLGNRIASSNINNAMIFASELRGKPITEKVMRKWRPLIGYAGMSFGMAAQQVVSHLLTIPTFKECFRDLTKIDFSSTFCKSALNHFLSAEKFWLDFGAGIPSLVGGAMMSAGSQKFFQWLVNQGSLYNIPSEARGSQSALLRYMGRSRALRVAKTAFRVTLTAGRASGVGGVFIMVGELVIFLAWTKVLEIPTMQMVWYLYDAPDIRRNTRQLLATATAIERAGGFAPETIDVSCTSTRVHPRAAPVEKCNSVDHLAQSLKDLDFYSRRYRERVTLARLTRSFPDYVMKWEKYIASFFAGKYLLEQIYMQRSESPSTLLSLYDTAFAVKSTWEEYFRASTAAMVQSHQIFLQEDMAKLESAFTDYKNSFKSELVINRSTFENRLADILVAFKLKITAQQPWNSDRMCGGFDRDPYFCRAMKILRYIPQKKDLFFSQNRNSFVGYNVEWTDLLSKSLPVEHTLRQLLCSNDSTFKSTATMSGFPATLDLPRLVALPNDPFYAESCQFGSRNSLFLAKDMDESADFTDIKPGALWLTNYSNYIDPLSVLTDVRVRLTSGATTELSRSWWNRTVLPDVLSFYKKYITSYSQMLEDNFFAHVSYESADLLVANNETYRGPRSVLNPSTENNLHQKVLNRQNVNRSLIGQMQIYAKTLEKVSSVVLNQSEKQNLSRKLQNFVLLFAEHTRHFKHINSSSALNAIPMESIGSPNPFLFSQDVSRTLFGNSFEEKTQRMGQLMDMSGELSADLIGVNFDDIDNIATEITFTAQQVSQMTPAEYKKYTVLQIVKHIRLLLEETNNYYDSYIFLAGLFNLTKE